MDKNNAWIYCHIDAPEDTHGALKGQYKRLETYAAQMGFVVAGFSQDLGNGIALECSGLQTVLEAASIGSFQILLVDSINRIGREESTANAFLKMLLPYNITVFSPLEGKIIR